MPQHSLLLKRNAESDANRHHNIAAAIEHWLRKFQQHPPPVPVSGDPWFGAAGNVLISEGADRDGPKDFLWIGFNSQTEWQNFLSLNQNQTLGWIGGPVILTSNNSMGFYFDPSQTIAAEVTAEGLQTSLDQIEANPSKFVPGLISRWYVPAIVEQVR